MFSFDMAAQPLRVDQLISPYRRPSLQVAARHLGGVVSSLSCAGKMSARSKIAGGRFAVG